MVGKHREREQRTLTGETEIQLKSAQRKHTKKRAQHRDMTDPHFKILVLERTYLHQNEFAI